MDRWHRLASFLVLPVIAFGFANSSGDQAERYVLPVTVTIEGTTVEFAIAVDIERNAVSATVVEPSGKITVTLGEAQYLGTIDLEPQPTITPVTQNPSGSRVDLQTGAIEVGFEELVRRNRKLEGQLVYIKGEIESAFRGLDSGSKRMEVLFEEGEYTRWDSERTLYAEYKGDLRFVEGDEVEIWGVVQGLDTGNFSEVHPVVEIVELNILSADDTILHLCQQSKTQAMQAVNLKTMQSAAIEATYSNLLRYFSNCAGAIVEFEGRITAVEFDDGKSLFDIDISDKRLLFADKIKATYTGEESYMKEDQVVVIGQIQDELYKGFNLVGSDVIQLKVTVLDIQLQ